MEYADGGNLAEFLVKQTVRMEEKDILYPEFPVVENLPTLHSNNALMFLKNPSPEKSIKNDSKTVRKREENTNKNKHGENFLGETHCKEREYLVKDDDDQKILGKTSFEPVPINTKSLTAVDFAAQMMASVSKLQDTKKEQVETPELNQNEPRVNSEVFRKEKYIPSAPTILKTAATMELKQFDQFKERNAVPIKRPAKVQRARQNLPVTAMEFEIIDAIRNNDVTIICGETGSGKSTQIPAYVYENGMCDFPGNQSQAFLVGITQPRRVAAVSTAKRICYELGQGDGQSINGSERKGNLVAYKTRFESAGCGDSTRIQFMTDGILLSEIQNDLLLRRYSVIILDETHERNLNTDVLIGLLSAALPLRIKAAQEDSKIPPLKLVLMSATLRVEDFTANKKLFPGRVPKVVTVPGRTHPVTIHHNKVSEINDYGTCDNVCEIESD